MLTRFFTLLTLALITFGCQEPTTPEGKYKAAVKEAIASSESSNDLFLGLGLGMSRQAYLDTCTVLNQKQLITMNSGGLRVQHLLYDSELDRPGILVFGPEFTKTSPPRVGEMAMTFEYEDWSPWNKPASADSLLPVVLDYFDTRFGEAEWITLEHPRVGDVSTRIENNRRIAVWVDDFAKVNAAVTDMTAFPRRTLGPQH